MRSTTPRVETPPLRAVNEITTIQKYGRMIGTETSSRNASSADWPAARLTARAVSRQRQSSRRARTRASALAYASVSTEHQCTSIRGGCSSRRMSMSRHSASAATTPITIRISDSAAPYAYWPFSNARR